MPNLADGLDNLQPVREHYLHDCQRFMDIFGRGPNDDKELYVMLALQAQGERLAELSESEPWIKDGALACELLSARGLFDVAIDRAIARAERINEWLYPEVSDGIKENGE